MSTKNSDSLEIFLQGIFYTFNKELNWFEGNLANNNGLNLNENCFEMRDECA